MRKIIYKPTPEPSKEIKIMDIYWKRHCVGQVNQWVRRRKTDGWEPTADDTWIYIQESWPKSDNHEEIFQRIGLIND